MFGIGKKKRASKSLGTEIDVLNAKLEGLELRLELYDRYFVLLKEHISALKGVK